MERSIDQYVPAYASTVATISGFIKNNEIYSIVTDIDWVAVLLVSAISVWIYNQYRLLEHGWITQSRTPLVCTTSAVLDRLATDLACFILTILKITAETLLEASDAWPTLKRNIREELDRLVNDCRPIALRLWKLYDHASHSHHANYARQRLRAACAWTLHVICFLATCSILMLSFGMLDEKGAPNEPLYNRPFLAPVWAFKALPENRPQVGSSSHYRSTDGLILI